MYFVQLKFSDSRSRAAELMEEHKAWLKRGMDEGLFLAFGSLAGGTGGMILAKDASRQDLDARLAEDPFVAEGVVVPEVTEFKPARADDRLAFLLD